VLDRQRRGSWRLGSALWLAASAALVAAAQEAEVYLEIQKWDFFRVPVLVEDFAADDLARLGLFAPRFSTGEEIEDLLARDLDLSDAFQVVRVRRGEEPAAGLLLDIADRPIDRHPQARVAGELHWDEGRVILRARLIDTSSRAEIFRRDYELGSREAPLAPERWSIHRLADDITRTLTGSPGCAATRIAFVRSLDSGKELALIDWDGFGESPATALGSIVVSPDWHPFQARVACTSFHAGQPQLVAVDLGSGGLTVLASGGTPSAPAHSRDGRWLAYASSESGDMEIYVARADGSQRRRLTFSPGIDTAPSWSPSGDRLVFTSDRTGRPQLFICDADGVSVEQLTYQGDWNDSADWSPISDRIVHVCMIDRRFELAVISAGGMLWRRLTSGGGCENPRWAPDGRHVVFTRSQQGMRQLWILDVNSGNLRQLTASSGGSYNPAWSGSFQERPGPVGTR